MSANTPANIIRLYKPTYLQMVENSIGTAMFRNFYIHDETGNSRDALDDGENSCAFYVSSVLTLFQKMERIHATIAKTEADLKESGWCMVEREADIMPGDVLVWGPKKRSDSHAHIGFALTKRLAVSTSSSKKTVVEHNLHMGSENREILAIYRMSDWS